MPAMTGRAAPSGTPSLWPSVLVHGGVLFALLAWFRVSKVLFSELEPSLLAWPALLLPDLGFVVLFEGVWLVASRGRGTRGWRLTVDVAHALVGLFVVLGHHFFINTGYRLPFGVAVYGLSNLGMVRDLLAVSAGGAIWRDLAVWAGALAAAVLLSRRAGREAIAVPLGRRLLPVAALGGSLLLVGVPLEDRQLRSLARNDLVAFVSGALVSAGPGQGVAPFMIEPEALYRAPELTSGEVARRPNVLLLLLESTGARQVGVEFERGLTPRLARFAERSVVVDTAYTTVSHTSKALVGLLCGMMPRLDMEIVEALEHNLPLRCLPHLLGELGYRTAFLQTALSSFENRPGLVANLGYQFGAYQETLERPPFEKMGYFGLDEFAMLEPAVRWAAAPRPEPFFLTLLTISPHHPYELPGEEASGTPEERYHATLRYQDRFVGELLDRLESSGALDETVVIVVGDHGEAHGEHQLLEHDAVPYEEVVWTPWLLHGPEEWIGPPRRIGGLRTHLDLLPTLLELLGAEWRGELPGASLLSTPGHERVVASCWYRNYCLTLRRGDRKAVYHFGHRPTELFDLSTDPLEQRDLAATLPPEELERLEAELFAYKLSIDGFWARHPAVDGPFDWWERDAELTPAGGSGGR